jgi:hypothetical protein
MAPASVVRRRFSRKNSIGRIGEPRIAPLDLLVKRPVLKATAAELTTETVHGDIGLAKGVHGISRGAPSVAQCFIIRLEMPSRKR